MALTLVRRASSRLPAGHFIFRTSPRATKSEVVEYLRAVYGVRVERITTYLSPGPARRAPGKRNLVYKLPEYKRVYVRVAQDTPASKPLQ